MESKIEWDSDANCNGTSLRGYLKTPWAFTELVARLLALSGQKAQERGDGYKVSVEFTGRFEGEVFTLYDYKGDDEIHIGGGSSLDVPALEETLIDQLKRVEPTSYVARRHYDELDGSTHAW